MAEVQFDSLSKDLATGTTRRRALAGLGALALGGAGFLGLTQGAAADKRRKCVDRCKNHCGDNLRNRKCNDRCRRKCEDR